MPWSSKHLKNESRPSQHCWRAVRSGAMKPPSREDSGEEMAGAGLEEVEVNQPIVSCGGVGIVEEGKGTQGELGWLRLGAVANANVTVV